MSHLNVWKTSNILALKFLQFIDGMNVQHIVVEDSGHKEKGLPIGVNMVCTNAFERVLVS